ncbi:MULTISPECIES: YceI family protein [unclassified Ketobacter]|uniref:YceI family protein n=1 Tax=unclassified Ketobacter TaxID=2639109 RepID=UPI000F16A47F|nr:MULTISPECIES: YceI family protein [unclassified Ketobacter]RLT91437.1 MAG: YceI family protein [Ketobacter sp. GenoA1]RLT96283.1 MAG: YceI family protein [Ketobacter sp.]|tara:strand:+ start:2322 stop:2912 length:591 start_codon:yes stop_codon:yes gene_type:complete
MKRNVRSSLGLVVVGFALLTSGMAQAAETYKMDTEGSHAFIQFKIQHLGFSWLLGRFNTFDGEFVLDQKNIENSKVKVTIDVASVDSNHGERDKHLRGKDFFEVAKYPEATFVSTRVEKTGERTAKITGDFTLKGVTKPVTLDAEYIGGGKDPWGGYRQGFEATTQLKLKDFGIDYNLGPASEVVDIYISVEGIRQ